MTGTIVRSMAGVVAALLIGVGVASAQAPVLSIAISGNTVTFNWSATPGAIAYRADVGLASGTYGLGSSVLGAITTLTVPGVPNGVYFVRLVALPGGEVSNEVVIQLPQPPNPPTNLQVARNGTAIVALWTPGVGGGAVTAYHLRAGMSPGATDFPALPVGGTSFAAGPVPPNTYYLRVVAVNAAGFSDASNEVAVAMPAGGACDAPPTPTLQASAFSTFLSVSWSPVPFASAYIFDATQNGVPVVTNAVLPPSPTGFSRVVPLATYGIAAKAVWACGSQSAPAFTSIEVNGAPPPGPRTPDPAPGARLPEPNYLRSVVEQAVAARPDLVAASCVEHGGNNRFLFELTRRLRAIDNRWGNNIKRGNEGLSQDIVAYNNSANPDEGATTGPSASRLDIYMYDVIGGHCGPSPGPNWAPVHQATINAGVRGVWTLQHYLAAGNQP